MSRPRILQPGSLLYGVVTTGEDWRFGTFHRQTQQIVQDIKLYRVPEGLDEVKAPDRGQG